MGVFEHQLQTITNIFLCVILLNLVIRRELHFCFLQTMSPFFWRFDQDIMILWIRWNLLNPFCQYLYPELHKNVFRSKVVDTLKPEKSRGSKGKKNCDATPQIAITFVPRDTSPVRTLWQIHLYFASVLYTGLEWFKVYSSTAVWKSKETKYVLVFFFSLIKLWTYFFTKS